MRSRVNRRGDDQMRELIAEGKISPAAKPRPKRTPRPLVIDRSASAIVLAEREEER
jgi:hypothetical protein